MIPARVIELAMDGGFDEFRASLYVSYGKDILWRLFATDPTFWQALGKALKPHDSTDFSEVRWMLIYAPKFYDLILTGGDLEKFWEELLD